MSDQSQKISKQLMQHAKALLLKESVDKKSWEFKDLGRQQMPNVKKIIEQICEEGIDTVQTINFPILLTNEDYYYDIGIALSKLKYLKTLIVDQSNYSNFNPTLIQPLTNLQHLKLNLGHGQNGETKITHIAYSLLPLSSLNSLEIEIGESGLKGGFCEVLGQSLMRMPKLYKFAIKILSFNHFEEKSYDVISNFLSQHPSLQTVDLQIKYCNSYSTEDNKYKQNIIKNLSLSNTITKASVEYEYNQPLSFPQVKARLAKLVQMIAFEKQLQPILLNHSGMILSDLYY